MTLDHPPRHQRQISLPALLAAFAFLAIWLGWSRSVVDLLDATDEYRQAVAASKAAVFATSHPK